MRGLTFVLSSSLFGGACGASEEPPLCPTGDCTLPGRTTFKWQLDVYPELLFQGDTCQDLGVKMMHAEITGIDDPLQFQVKDVECNQKQVTFVGLPFGNYSVTLTPLDGDGNVLVKAPIIAQAMAGTPENETLITVDVPYEAWSGTYTGTFLFKLSWEGASCETAVPAVVTQTLTLMSNGQVASAVTDVGQKLDGSDPKPCRKLSEPFAQFAEGLSFGPATLIVTGEDANGAVAFEKVFDTFVGAAKNNPTITFDVSAEPAPAPPM